jgi:putative nucleotidyltransferase with HDIG domain
MLKKIATTQLRPGMYVHQLVGSWLDHPFWKKTFPLTDQKQLDLIHASPIKQVWIDTSRGADVPEPEPEGADDDALTRILTSIMAEDTTDDAPCSLSEELERAGRIVESARGAIKAMFEDARLGRSIDAQNYLPLVDDITQSLNRNPGAIVSLARLKTSDDYTYLHCVAVCALMVALARQLGLTEDMTREAGLAGLVHDIGKVHMPAEILNKPGPLTREEFDVMRDHPKAGYDILMEARGVGAAAMEVCLHHHEKMNGTGYPDGQKGDEISLLARMGAVCDVYDAITSNRPYKAGWDPGHSIQKMAQWSRDGHFDDRVLQAFIKGVGIYPIGSLVRLASERIAVVVDQTPGNLLTPVVKVILVIATHEMCEPEVIDLSTTGTRERIASRENAEAWGLGSIDDHWRLQTPASASVVG